MPALGLAFSNSACVRVRWLTDELPRFWEVNPNLVSRCGVVVATLLPREKFEGPDPV